MKWEENVRKVVPYVAGEQPNRPNMNARILPHPGCEKRRKIWRVQHSDYIRIQMPSRWWMPWQHIMM